MIYQKWDSESEQWADLPELVRFDSPAKASFPGYFFAWVITGNKKSYELLREMRIK